MKAKEAHKILEPFSGDELYKEARVLYNAEADRLIEMRCHGITSARAIEGIVDQVSDWFRKVAEGLNWETEDTVESIITYERGDFFLKNKVMDPKLAEWGARTRANMARGDPFAMLEAMKPGDLDAVTSLMMANLTRSLKLGEELDKARKDYAEKYGKTQCEFGVDARDCSFQETFVLDPNKLPTNTSGLIFVCNSRKECERERR